MIEARLKEIQAEKIELRSSIDTATDLEEVRAKVASLVNEENELRSKLEMAKQLEPNAIEPDEKRGVVKMGENKIYGVETPEYRNAFMKDLMGIKLDEVEVRALTSASDSAGAAIPVQTMNMVIEKLEQTSALYNLVSVSFIPGGVRFAVADAKNDASWKTEGSDGTPTDDTVKEVVLGGHELIKLVEITAKVKAMTIPAFEAYIVNELAKKMAIAIENAILNGTGNGQPKGILATGVVTNAVQYTKAGMTYKELLTILASLPTMYHSGATFVCPRALFFADILGMETASGEKVVVVDAQSPAKFNVLGYPVVIADRMPVDTILFGDLSYYKFNFAQGIEIGYDDSVGFKSGKRVYRGLAVADGQLALDESFVKATRKTT